MKVFLDANVLFSAGLGGESFDLLWRVAEAGRVQLITTDYCRTEARENLAHKRPDALDHYAEVMKSVGVVTEDQTRLTWAKELIADKDAPILAAAVAAHADVLLTGDLKHFAPLMEREDLPIRVRTVRAFLMQGPDG